MHIGAPINRLMPHIGESINCLMPQ